MIRREWRPGIMHTVIFLGFLLTGALAGVPLLVAAFDRRGRTLSDLLSGTTIEGVEAPEPAGQP